MHYINNYKTNPLHSLFMAYIYYDKQRIQISKVIGNFYKYFLGNGWLLFSDVKVVSLNCFLKYKNFVHFLSKTGRRCPSNRRFNWVKAFQNMFFLQPTHFILLDMICKIHKVVDVKSSTEVTRATCMYCPFTRRHFFTRMLKISK